MYFLFEFLIKQNQVFRTIFVYLQLDNDLLPPKLRPILHEYTLLWICIGEQTRCVIDKGKRNKKQINCLIADLCS